MYGWINGCLEDLVLTTYGAEIWEQIKLDAHCHVPTGDFFRSVNYDDESTFCLVEAACKILGTKPDDILEAFGRHFMQFLEQNGYESTMKAQGSTLREWIKNINEPHRLLRSRFPKSNLPEFWTENDDSDEFGETVFVHYYSTRGSYFSAVVVGIIKEAAKRYFDKEISMELVMVDETERAHINYHAVWRVPNIGKDYALIQNSSITPPLEASYLENHSDLMASIHDEKLLRCPFHHGNLNGIERNSSLSNFCKQQTDSDKLATSSVEVDVGLCGHDFRRIFPYHIVVDRSMRIIQVGNTLRTMMLQRGRNIINCFMSDLFTLTLPDSFPLNWNAVRKLRDVSIEMIFTSEPLTRDACEVKFRGEIMFLKQHCTDLNDINAQAVFLINPYIAAMSNLMSLDLSLNDLPKHSFQRDLLLIGEHLRSETDNGIKLSRLSKRLDHESKKAKDALKMKRIFVRYVSHEIRTPLNVSILGLKCLEDELKSDFTKSQLTTGDSSLPTNLTEMLDDVKLSCALAVEILNDLLLYEKIDDGIFSIFPSKIQVRQLIEEAEKLFRLQAHAANVDFVLDLHNKVLDTAIVNIDKSKLHQVLRNLVTNAIKFTPAHGEVRLTCRILQEEMSMDGRPIEINSSNLTSNPSQPHYLPLLQRSDRGRLSRSDSLSSLSSTDIFSDMNQAATIHFATQDPENSISASASLSTASMHNNEIQPSPAKEESGHLILESSALVMKQKALGASGHPEASLSKLASNAPRKKRLHWEEEVNSSIDVSNQSATVDFGLGNRIVDEDSREDNVVRNNIVQNFVRISVQDTGPGISTEDQAQLFHEFIQVKADKLQNSQGSGLGLWIAANIMNMHGGRIGVLSEGEGKGSTFLIDIPLVSEVPTTSIPSPSDHELHPAEDPRQSKRPRLDPSMQLDNNNLIDLNNLATTSPRAKGIPYPPMTESPVEAPKRPLRNTNVLVVDDVASNRKVVCRILRDRFALIEEAENGQVAVNKVAQSLEKGNPFHLILMDFMMPVMNGLDATRAIQELARQSDKLSDSERIVIIGVTGNGLEEDIDAFKEAGAEEVMLKPLDFSKFLAVLQMHGFEIPPNHL